MKILLFSGGFLEYMIELANALSLQDGISSVMLVLPEKYVKEEQIKQINSKVIFKPFLFIDYVSIRQNFKMTRQLIKLINDFNPDILHVQADGQHPWFGLALPFLKNCKIVNTVHDPAPHLGDKISTYRDMRFSKWMLKRYADAYIVHGKTLKENLLKNYNGLKSEKIHIVPHGHLNMYRKFQQGGQKSEQAENILFFGRIWEYKGLKYLMQAEPIIRKAIPNLKIVIAGKGEELSIYDEFIVNKDSYIIKNYAIPLAEVSDLFDEASLVVLPYIEATQSGVIPVAYPFCKPVVASAVGALPEVVIDGKTGFLIPPADPQALADKIIFLLLNPKIRHEMGLSAKRYSDEKLDWKEIAKTTLEIYSSLK